MAHMHLGRWRQVTQHCVALPRPARCHAPRLSQKAGQAAPSIRTYAATIQAPRVEESRPVWVDINSGNRPAAAHEGPMTPEQEILAGTRPSPATLDAKRFKLHWSVDFWKNYTTPAVLQSSSTSVAAKVQYLFRQLQQVGVFSSRQAAAYWSYSVLRTSVLASQGLGAVLAAQAADAAGQRGRSPGDKPAPPSSSAPAADKEDTAVDRFARMIRWGMTGPLFEAMTMYWQDYQNIANGTYKLPWDMTTSGHHQWNPLWVLNSAVDFVREAGLTLGRRTAGKADQLWMQSPLYPDYYQSSFHYQTDGWLSSNSAKVYESSTETLFVGRQDAMQRQTLVPLAPFMASLPFSTQPPKIIDVAAGTGRFATFLKDNHRAAEVTVLELSPFYLQQGRENMAEWTRLRDPASRHPSSFFVQAAAEKMPAQDNTYDALTCIYLFHELPPQARRDVAKEMARVVKPGGMVVITDSIQLGDRPANDKAMGAFQDFNEPYYRSYTAEDMGALFEEAGLKADQKLVGGSSKTLSFRKPAANSA